MLNFMSEGEVQTEDKITRRPALAGSGHRGITRVDLVKRGVHGWYVRVRFKGRTCSRWLRDATYGGPEKALQAAVKERNRLETEAGKPRSDRMIMAATSRNRSGISGVKQIEKLGTLVYQVTWNPRPGKVSSTTVSIRRWGEDEALKRACAIRRAKEREIYGAVLER